MSFENFEGVMPAFITPFDEKGEYSESCAKQMMDWQISKGIAGYYLLGSNGYGPALDCDKRKKAMESMVKIVSGRVKTIAHIGAVSLKDTIELAKHAESIGCDAISALPSYYYLLKDEEMYLFYDQLAKSVKIPLVIYAKTADYEPTVEMFEKLSQIENIKGIKYTGSDYYMMALIKGAIRDDIKIYTGRDEMYLSSMVTGSDGVIGGTYNLYPELAVQSMEFLKKGDIMGARERYLLSIKLTHTLFKYGNLQSVMRVAMTFMGIDSGYNPLPFAPISNEKKSALKDALLKIKEETKATNLDLFDKMN